MRTDLRMPDHKQYTNTSEMILKFKYIREFGIRIFNSTNSLKVIIGIKRPVKAALIYLHRFNLIPEGKLPV